MRDPFKDSGSADDWFNNLWTADVDMSTAMYGNTGTDMLYKSLIPKSPELTDVIDRADKRFGLGDALKSLFALLYMKEPEKNNDGGILEQPVTDGVIKDEKYPQLKALCEDKKLPAFSAVCSFAERIEGVTDNAEVQKAAEIAGIISTLGKQAENLAERIKGETKPDKRLLLINRLFKKQKQINDLNEKLREQRIKISAEIADNISAAAKKAFDAASQTAAVLRAFGDDDAAGGNTETDGALLDRVRENDTLKKISVMLGKYREIIADKRKNSFSYGLGEKYDITYGNDISNCLSSELALLGAPETEILFFKRYYEKHLQQYRRREPSVKGDGDIIVLADESSSTREIAPWVKAFALALMDIALHGNKKFALVHFANSRNVKTDVFESGKYTTDDVLAAAEHFFGGGTDFETPLNEALRLLTNGFESADVVIITDGECEVSDEFAKRFTEEKLKNRLTVTGILLSADDDCGKSLLPFCDKIYRLGDMSADEIALEVIGKKV